MARATKEALVLVLDVGLSARVNRPSCLEQAVECASKIVQRKIFSKSKDDIALVLIGSKQTNNRLYSGADSGYEHINVVRNLQTADWELVGLIQELGVTDKGVGEGDCFDGLIVAMDHIHSFIEEKVKYSECKIVLFTNLMVKPVETDTDSLIDGLKQLHVDLTLIGADVYSSHNAPPSAELMLKVIEAVDGYVCSYDDAIRHLIMFPRRAVKAMPWNCNMEIGTSHSIPMAGYCKIREEKPGSWKNCHTSNSSGQVAREATYHKVDEEQTPVEADELIQGYLYGDTRVPFDKVDQEKLAYQSGPKCLQVIGCTKTQNIPPYLHLGSGAMIFTGQKGNEASFIAVSAIAHALYQMDLCLIVRRVYRANSAVHIGAMYPLITDEYEGLSYVELPFSDDMRQLHFNSLKSKENKIQDDAMDALIDAMDLHTAGEDEDGTRIEVLECESVLNPYIQHLYKCLSLRAINPKVDLPPFDNPILVDVPHSIAEQMAVPLSKLKEIFPLEEVVRATWNTRKGGADIFSGVSDQPTTVDGNITDTLEHKATDISTVTPVEDFLTLLQSPHLNDFNSACSQMKEVIDKLILTVVSSEGENKLMDCMQCLKRVCVEKNTTEIYNTWIYINKNKLQRNNKLWERMKNECCGYITTKECANSAFSPEDGEKYFETGNTTQEQHNNDEDMTVDDLLDEM